MKHAARPAKALCSQASLNLDGNGVREPLVRFGVGEGSDLRFVLCLRIGIPELAGLEVNS
jgi:hypothetical protein